VDELLKVTVREGLRVSARLMMPRAARACYVFAHGAGAGMDHAFMSAAAHELGELSIATLRYQFPYMERRSRRPDPPPLCHATVRAAIDQAAQRAPGMPLFAGGRSFGGRMTSQAQAAEPLPGVRGLAFLGFPLHPAGKPSDARAEHLSQVHVPLLFLQGTNDALAEAVRMQALVRRLGERATLHLVADADHSFHVPVRSGRRDAEVRGELLGVLARWVDTLL
jgi:predicted alpha/beta-hydrolase family hydrolase